ncbi:hypothetical protein [Candidatus Roseilinea sp. NK_OTU-006]|uniref:hypothetical protein n=1 Tax=Candidatus Roseilinea sp. NK_OTU-006 TaxID=2704250 RepID=UPI00145C8BF1|nr:hypothetical protein [Candidatus Roseilinea sp. NK_OTU-006]
MLRLLIVSVLALILASCSPAPAAMPAATDTPEPTATPAPTPTPSATAAETRDASPSRRSVWDTQVSPGEALGQCAGSAPLPVYGLVQITPFEDGLEWRNQEPQPYRMKRVAPGVYRFAGPSAINDGVVTMTVTFWGENSLSMVREFTPNAAPGCTYRHEYTGEFKWFR